MPARTRMTAASCAVLLIIPLVASIGCGGRPAFDGDRAYADLVAQCDFGPRYPGSAGHDLAREWLVARLSESADEVTVQEFTHRVGDRELELANIVASYRPECSERVLLGAHWDTRAVAERDPDPARRGEPILGANDGASGVAVLLEVGRLVAERPPGVGVDIVLFDAEDGGDEGGLGAWCLGSSYYAARMGSYCPRYAVVVDMVGDCDLDIPREPYSRSASPELVELVWAAAERAGSTSFSRRTGIAIYDDHVPLIQAGLEAIVLIDLDYPYWHTHEDTPDKCCPSSLREVGEAVTEFLYSL